MMMMKTNRIVKKRKKNKNLHRKKNQFVKQKKRKKIQVDRFLRNKQIIKISFQEITPIDLESTRSITRDQQKSSSKYLFFTFVYFSHHILVPTSESSKKKSNVPIGFPTSKIIIPSLQTSRVGLSRKSSAIKSLHPNLNQRTVHE